jgi:hypothetical protein
VAVARVMIEQAKTEQAERARAASEEAAAAAAGEAAAEAAAAAELQQLDEEMAALATRRQQVQAQLGSNVRPPAAPLQSTEETMCVVCFDAPKDHLIVPCGHQCVCARCAEQLTKTRTPTCPVCREPIQQTVKVFCS